MNVTRTEERPRWADEATVEMTIVDRVAYDFHAISRPIGRDASTRVLRIIRDHLTNGAGAAS